MAFHPAIQINDAVFDYGAETVLIINPVRDETHYSCPLINLYF